MNFKNVVTGKFAVSALALTLASATQLLAVPAFPGAEGFGANAVGGRGGSVYHVTNLNDSGAGSFRDAVGTSNRTVVFDVGGIIRINSVVVVKSNVTIAGQTAPGDGVTIYGHRISFSDANNSICRYMRFREGINGDSGTDAVGIASGSNMIFDHVSASWGRDETFSISGTISNITLQDCMIGQGLLIHSAGGLVQTSGGVSIFRSLYIDNWMRNPKIKGVNDYQNNVVYNWGSGGGYIPAGDSAGLTYANMVGNYFIGGPNTGVGTSPFKTGNLNYSLYYADNLEDLDLDGVLDGTPVTAASFPTLNLVASPFAYPAPAKVLTPQQALAHVITYAGASLHRDYADTYMINELLSYGTVGAQITNESEIGGIGTLAAGLTPLDTDQDGMPDWWEQVAGTNSAVADNNGDINSDGYTNLENYINSLAPVGVPGCAITGILDDTGASSADGVTNDTMLFIRGTAPAGSTVALSRVDTGLLGSVIADASGNWIYDYTGTVLADRYYGFTAIATPLGGNASLATPAYIVKVDTTVPAAPAITGLVTSPNLVFSGTAEPLSQIAITLSGVGVVATATTDGVGSWSANYVGGALAPGLYSFSAIATDLAGNLGAASAAYIVDTNLVSPTFTSINQDTGVSATDLLTKDTSLIFSGTAPANSSVAISRVGTGVIGTVTATAGGAWTFDYTATVLASGQYTFTAVASLGGNSSPVSQPFIVTVDTVAPTINSITRRNPSTSATTATTLVYRVTFAEPVINVDVADFALTKAAGVTGTIASLAQVSSSVYDVTVTGAGGDGTIRLDRAANSTIADFAANSGSTSTYTGGQSYTMRLVGSGVWDTSDSGGLWSDSANWEAGVIATGSGVTADFSTRDLDETVTAVLDTPRTIGRLVLGDADTTNFAAWTINNNGNAANKLTFSGATPTIQVNAPSTASGDTVDVPAANAYPFTLDLDLAGTAGLTKTGVGTLQITKPSSLTGALTITKGIFQIADGGSMSPSSVSIATSQQLRIAGGTFTPTGDISMTSGTGTAVIVSGGVATLKKIIPSNARNASVRVSGGVMTATDISFQRSGDSETQTVNTGVLISGGESTVGTIGLGTNNSWGGMTVSGGKITVTGILHNGYQVSSARGGVIYVSGGELNVLDAANGLVMSRNPGTQANNVSKLLITGGATNLTKLTLGYDATSSAGSATVSLNYGYDTNGLLIVGSGSGELNIGAGGIVKNGTSGMTTTITLNSGTIGALAPWSTTHPLVLAGTPANAFLRAASPLGVTNDFTLSGALTGAGGFAKTGAGTLTLDSANTFTGDVAVNQGTLALTGSLATGGTVNVNTGATLTGTGTSNKAVALNSGGSIAPGLNGLGTFTAGSMTWNGGGRILCDLASVGSGSDLLAVTGALTKGSAGSYEFAFSPAGPLVIGTTYTLASFGSTSFSAADFSASGLGYGKGTFSVDASNVRFTVTSDGTGQLAYLNWAAGYAFPLGLNGPSDDADGDSQSNLLELILGQNPLSAGAENVTLITVSDGGSDYPALRFLRRIARGDIGLEVRVTTDLDFAATLGAVQVSAVDQGDGTELVVVRSAVSIAAQPRQFLRLQATLP